MKKPLVAIIAVVLIIAAIIVYNSYRHSENGSGNIRISGNIEATTVEVSFKVPGRVVERLVDEGESVKNGQLVARLDDVDFNHEIAQRRAELEAVHATLNELLAGSRKEEIAQAEAELAAIRVEARNYEKDYRRQEALFKREVIPQQKLDSARTAFENASARERRAAEILALVRKGPRKEKIEHARAKLREAEAALSIATTRLGYASLKSPTSGMVMSKNIEPGELVAVGTPVITVGDLESVWLRGYINETDLGRVKLGQKAKVTIDTWPGKAYNGTITFIASEAEFTPKNVQTEKERVKLVYRVKITIPNPSMELKPGMPADAEIETGTSDQQPATGK